MDEELAKRVSAGVASWAKREAANFEWRMVISSKSSTKVAILADRPEIEARDPERSCADLGVPAIEAAEVEVGRAVRQPPRLDRIKVVNQKQEDVAVRGIQRGRVSGDVDPRIVDARRPVEHAGDFPARIVSAVSGDTLHGFDQFMVIYTTIVATGDCAQFNTSVLNLECLE